ncbi:hypothetical protein [Thiocystis violacea]|uniref:hypothetical protein n=1 Tax=Thiocystis violacea TaxID=13725 RepID=UPI001902FC50|nr:hypothetical protein [Thiocystis violacea]MBK1725313.1 hypothetical protein [Thiocystis violacea]
MTETNILDRLSELSECKRLDEANIFTRMSELNRINMDVERKAFSMVLSTLEAIASQQRAIIARLDRMEANSTNRRTT